MPVIRIDFDEDQIDEKEVLGLSNAIQKIVSDVTEIEDVFVYANNSQIKVKVAPIEIFIQMSDHKIKDIDALVAEIKRRLIEWKNESSFSCLINMSFIPMPRKIEVGI